MAPGVQKNSISGFRGIIYNKNLHIYIIGILTLIVSFVFVCNGAEPKKYDVPAGQKSNYDITTPRDIIDTVTTEQNRIEASNLVAPIFKRDDASVRQALEALGKLFPLVDNARKDIKDRIAANSAKKEKEKKSMDTIRTEVLEELFPRIDSLKLTLSSEQVKSLLTAKDWDFQEFQAFSYTLVTRIMSSDIMPDGVDKSVKEARDEYLKQSFGQQLKDVGYSISLSLIGPNMVEDIEKTEEKRKEAYNSPDNEVKYEKGSRILSTGQIVTGTHIKMLEELNLLKIKGKIDYLFAAGIFAILFLLFALLTTYMYIYHRRLLGIRHDLILLAIIIIFSLFVAFMVRGFSVYAIPVSMAAMLISILLDVKLAVITNFILTIMVAFITRGDINFVYVSFISGTAAAFSVMKANQRSRLTLAGLIVSVINAVIVLCLGIINKGEIAKVLVDSGIGFVNGMASIIITLGTLPFWESTFNIITPLKLLELSDPNQPLIKRQLLEAPGTYHHSLMVGNLAEVATEAIGGNALLARVGAYYHDIGKLKRPYFFKENQLGDNPHDRMTANLSTLVITSHTRDGVDLAVKNKIPLAIRDIISQHHGTTVVAYFYHKAKKGEKGETVRQENFRYEGPRPMSKEAAVVMLADSVEAAVKSMTDRTEGKIAGLVRKIIKDKLDDGQLDLCDLTLKDLDLIAKGFMKVLSGYFHEREEYPEIKMRQLDNEEASDAVYKDIEIDEGRVVIKDGIN